jgi:excisionase family DNA binding protein
MSQDHYEIIDARLNRIEHLLQNNKKVLNFDEAVELTGFSKSYLYKLTSQSQIPYYRPSGKRIYFDREELEVWLLSNKIKSEQEIEKEASNYLIKKSSKK